MVIRRSRAARGSREPVAEEDDAVAERVGLGQLEIDPGFRRLEQALSPSDEDGVHISATARGLTLS